MLSQPGLRKKLFLLILVSAAAFVLFSPSLARLEGGELKDLTLMDINGNKVRLFELANDKPLLLISGRAGVNLVDWSHLRLPPLPGSTRIGSPLLG